MPYLLLHLQAALAAPDISVEEAFGLLSAAADVYQAMTPIHQAELYDQADAEAMEDVVAAILICVQLVSYLITLPLHVSRYGWMDVLHRARKAWH
jgi:hypothetical protein